MVAENLELAGMITRLDCRCHRLWLMGIASSLSICGLLSASPAEGTDNPVPGAVDLVFVGDIMLADLPGKAMARGVDPFAEFAQMLEKADVAIGNLECVVATGGHAVKKPWTFRADPQVVLPVLSKHFDAVSLANNHSGDFGHAALNEQLDLLDKLHLPYFGGGRNVAHARTPLMLERNGLRIALLAYNDFKPRAFEAGPNWPGVAWSVDEQVVADIKNARNFHHADLVIPFMHWGPEHEPEDRRQQDLGRLMLDAGADLVVGSHPHVTQGIEYYRGKLIVHSLGNFVFDGFEEGPARHGWLLRLRMDRQGVVAWDTVVAHLDDEGIPHLQQDLASPSGIRGSTRITNRRAMLDPPLVSAAVN